MTVNAFYKHSRIKQYLKEGRARRIETVVNSPTDLGVQRRLINLAELVDRARIANRRLLECQRAGQGCAIETALWERISQPSLPTRCDAMRGELDETQGAARRAHETAMHLGLQPLAAAALVMEALSYAFRGQREPMERVLRVARDIAPDDADLDASAWGAGRGLCTLLREDRDGAQAAFTPAVPGHRPPPRG